ncbi:MAG: hypothetical protein ACRCZG_03680 [Culicoidibacterales bacterium]
MANAMYTKAKQKLLEANINFSTDAIKAVAVDLAAYTVNLATHEFLSDIPAGARIATSANLGTKTVTDGVFDAADISIAGVTGATIEAVVLYKDTGVAATSALIAILDTATGLPFTPNGGSLDLQWSNGTSKIFAL